MQNYEIIDLWKKGLSKQKLAEIYKRNYNNHIKLIRSSVRHRHSGRFISNYEALEVVERILYKYIIEQNDKK